MNRAGREMVLVALLATDRVRLRELRRRLHAQRVVCPLFDTTRFTRDLEHAYLTIWQRHQAKEGSIAAPLPGPVQLIRYTLPLPLAPP
jgi:hypothetical protein